MQCTQQQCKEQTYNFHDLATHPTTLGDLSLSEQQDQRRNESAAIKSQHLATLSTIQGVYPSSKAEGICRLIYENVNGLTPCLDKNNKLMKLCNMIEDMQVDIVGICEHRINFAHKDVLSGPRQLFQRKATMQATAGHNVHENIGRIQELGWQLPDFVTIKMTVIYRKKG